MKRLFQYLWQARLMIGIAVFSGALLTLTETTLAPRIAENIRRQILEQVPDLVGGGPGLKTEVIDSPAAKGQMFAARSGEGNLAGWVISATAMGYSGPITVLIGCDASGSRLTGIHVLRQTETPGLGALIAEPEFESRFKGLSTDAPVTVVGSEPTGQQVQALTGATVSSLSVATAVNNAMEELRGALANPSALRPNTGPSAPEPKEAP